MTAAQAPTPTVILVHGAWFGPWAWDTVRERLAEAGLRSETVSLVPATYVLCTADALFPVEAQRTIAGLAGADVREIDTDHSPMLSSPTVLAALLADVAGHPLPAAVD
jgi:hypothetical protein